MKLKKILAEKLKTLLVNRKDYLYVLLPYEIDINNDFVYYYYRGKDRPHKEVNSNQGKYIYLFIYSITIIFT